MSDDMKIKVTKDGPYMVSGGVPLKDETLKKDSMGKPEKWMENGDLSTNSTYALCRCGKSTNKPFCTGDHAGFDGTETTKRNAFDERARVCAENGNVVLLQDPNLCIGAGFCHGKYYVDKTVMKNNTLDIALQQTYDCAGGSLLIKIDGVPQEPKLDKSIAMTSAQRPGALLVKGGIQVESADGYNYEQRNRIALCSCGRSRNKPFCDGAHLR